MGCFLSCGKRKKRANKICSNQDTKSDDQFPSNNIEKQKVNPLLDMKTESSEDGGLERVASPTYALTLTFQELAIATKNFGADFLIGEGGFGRVYKGWLQSNNQIVAIKKFNLNQPQGNQGFLFEVLMLSLLHHPNLVALIGYCTEGENRLSVYEYMPRGSLKDHLHDLPSDQNRLDWNMRMKIAAGVAKGLEYLHDKAKPPVIHRNLKCSSILLDEEYHPKLSDFRVAKLGPVGDMTYLCTSVEGTFGYIAPEYAMTGKLSLKSDVYSFGVVLLEIITGRKAVDFSRADGEESLVAWARSSFKDCRKFSEMADPSLQGHYPARGLYQALVVAGKCVEEKPSARPPIADVATALDHLASEKYDSKM